MGGCSAATSAAPWAPQSPLLLLRSFARSLGVSTPLAEVETERLEGSIGGEIVSVVRTIASVD